MFQFSIFIFFFWSHLFFTGIICAFTVRKCLRSSFLSCKMHNFMTTNIKKKLYNEMCTHTSVNFCVKHMLWWYIHAQEACNEGLYQTQQQCLVWAHVHVCQSFSYFARSYDMKLTDNDQHKSDMSWACLKQDEFCVGASVGLCCKMPFYARG